jgi:hypothetical protein
MFQVHVAAIKENLSNNAFVPVPVGIVHSNDAVENDVSEIALTRAKRLAPFRRVNASESDLVLMM